MLPPRPGFLWDWTSELESEDAAWQPPSHQSNNFSDSLDFLRDIAEQFEQISGRHRTLPDLSDHLDSEYQLDYETPLNVYQLLMNFSRYAQRNRTYSASIEDLEDPDEDPVLKIWSFSISCVMLALCLFGTLTNAVSALIFMSQKMRSPINTILTGLCGIDTVVVLLAVPLMVLHGLNVLLELVILDQITTYTVISLYPLAMAAKTCSVWAFVLITFERYMAVCHPLKARSLFYSNCQACVAILILIVCSVLYNFVRFWEYRLESDNDFALPRPEFLLRKNETYYRVYYTGMFLVTHFLVPFTILLVLNSYIIHTIAVARRQRERLSRQELREHKTAQMLVVVTVVFGLTNTLPFIINIIEAVYPKMLDEFPTKRYAAYVFDISNTLVMINSSSTIFIYYHFSSKFRSLFRKRYMACCRFLDKARLRRHRSLYFTGSNFSGNSFQFETTPPPPTPTTPLGALFRNGSERRVILNSHSASFINRSTGKNQLRKASANCSPRSLAKAQRKQSLGSPSNQNTRKRTRDTLIVLEDASLRSLCQNPSNGATLPVPKGLGAKNGPFSGYYARRAVSAKTGETLPRKSLSVTNGRPHSAMELRENRISPAATPKISLTPEASMAHDVSLPLLSNGFSSSSGVDVTTPCL